MKKKKTPLHFAQQLEDFQTARKAKEVNEIYKFDSLKENLKQRHLTLNRRMEKLRQKSLQRLIEEPEMAEEQNTREKDRALQELAEFERQAYDMQVSAQDSEFGAIAEIQGFRYQSDALQPELKQLPEAHVDAFAHELTSLTEHELQKELEQNEKILQDSLKTPGRLERSTEPPPKEPEPQPVPAKEEDTEKSEPENVRQEASEAESEAQENTEPEIIPEKKKSESSLIYFRSNPPPSEE